MKALVGYVVLFIMGVAEGVELLRPSSSSGDSSTGFTFSGDSSSDSSFSSGDSSSDYSSASGDSLASSASSDLHPDVVPFGQGSGNYSSGDIFHSADIVTSLEPTEGTAAPTLPTSKATPGYVIELCLHGSYPFAKFLCTFG